MAERKPNLTKSMIDKAAFNQAAPNPNARQIIWDGALPGFGVRLFPTGRKAFVVNYRVQGRVRLMTLGRYGVFTLDQARDAARDVLVRVSKGEDPLSQKKADRHAETFGELWRTYLDGYAKAKKRSWKEDERRFARCVPDSWLSRKMESITPKEVEALHFRIGQKSKVEANRTLALLSKMYGLARIDNPTKGIEKFEEVKRDRWLKGDELLRLKEAVAREPNQYVRAAIWLWLLTGVRKNELLTARWENVDLKAGTLHLKRTKSGKPQIVHLAPTAALIFENLPREVGNPYVFPGGKEGHHLVNIYKPWYRIVQEADLEGLRIHDLRRSFASMIVQDGGSLQLASKLLGHSNTRTTEIYAHLSDTQAREAVAGHGDRLKEIIGEVGI